MSKIDEYGLGEAIARCKVDMIKEFASYGDAPDLSIIDMKQYISLIISDLPGRVKNALSCGYTTIMISQSSMGIPGNDKLYSKRDEIFDMLKPDLILILEEFGLQHAIIANCISIDIETLRKAINYEKMVVLL